jgi:anti-repressor protein
MNELQKIFNYNGKIVRTVVVDGELMFVAKDICDVLEIGDTSKAVVRLTENMKGTNSIPTPGGDQEMLTVSEAGVYKLVFTSRKPEAERFTNWIASEVIPSIRKHGAYMTPDTLEKAIQSPDFLIQLANKLKDEQAARIAAEEKLSIAAPKAETYDIIAEDEGFLLTASEVAKTIALPGLNETAVRKILREQNILCTTKNELTADAIRKGFGRMVVGTFDTGYREIPIKTPKFRGKAIDLVARCWKQTRGVLF